MMKREYNAQKEANMTLEEAAVIIGNIPINEGDVCYSIAEYQEAKTIAVQALIALCKDCVYRNDILDLARKGVIVGNRNYKSVCNAINDLPPVRV